MAKRYSKFHSNYILRKKHQDTLKGTIWERDWVTIGAQHQLEKGKRVFYGDTNFLFTDNSFTSYKKRHSFSKWIGQWNYDEAVTTASDNINVVSPNWESTDLRDFAYYGSCVKLIENAVSDIVKWFPGRMVIGSEPLYVGEKYGESIEVTEEGETIVPYTNGNILLNPFGLDLYRNVYDQNTDENIKRYVADTYWEYDINNETITQYNVTKLPTDCLGREIVKVCEISIQTESYTMYFIDGYDVFGTVVYVEGENPYKLYYTNADNMTEIYPSSFGFYTDPIYIHSKDLNRVYILTHRIVDEETSEERDEVVLYNENVDDKYTLFKYELMNEGEPTGSFISVGDYENLDESDKDSYEPRYSLLLSVDEYVNFDMSELSDDEHLVVNSEEISGMYDGIDMFVGEIGKIQTLQEHPENVREYVESLWGIEHLLLNNKTNPLYRATLKTPIETNNGYVYAEKFYTWPSTNGYIEVDTVMYTDYLNSLLDVATIFDDTWCDNLWRSMTHEAIRNFDWSYTREYAEGDEEAFIEGGKRMMDVMHIYGTIADELKRYVDGIKMSNVVTYDGYNNMTSAEMTDKLAYRGWDVFSIIPLFGDEENQFDFSRIRINEGFVKTYIQKHQEFITEADYYKLPSESQSKYTFNYIRVYTGHRGGDLYDAVGTDVIMAEDYASMTDNSKYTPRYQNTIIAADDYSRLPREEKSKYIVYEYIKLNDDESSGNIMLYTDYDNTRWQEEYIINGNVACLRDKDNEDTCARPKTKITIQEYSNLRKGKYDYVPYTYRKKDDIRTEEAWINTENGEVITGDQYLIQEANIKINGSDNVYIRTPMTDVDCNTTTLDIIQCENIYYGWSHDGSIDPYNAIFTISETPNVGDLIYEIMEISPNRYEIAEKGPAVTSYYNGKRDNLIKYTPYIIEYNGVEYPVVSFYISEYRYIGSDTAHNPETITMYEYNSKEWCDDYSAYEYFKPNDVNNYVSEANQDDLPRYTWETYFELDDEDKEEYRPYRYLNIYDKDTVITPEQYEAINCKKDWEPSEYSTTLDTDVRLTPEEYANVTQYILYNVVTPAQYETLSNGEKMYFAPYYPMRTYGFGKWFNARNVNAETMAEQDIRFSKELMLLSKEMFATKGTIQGIDMIMSMFGFSDTYTLTEKYHLVDINNHMYDDAVYDKLELASNYDDPGASEEGSHTLSDNVPMGTVELHDIDYIIPYYSSEKKYIGGEVYFQAKGGWGGKTRDLSSQTYDYMETLSYLKIIDTVTELLNVNARTVKNGDIYYVMSIVDIVDYDENPPENPTHFFILNDDFNPHLYRSWTNIDMTDESSPITKTAKYLDNIISTSIGNNPHTGYGKYDLGQQYLDYMRKPFKYYLDNYVLDSEIRDTMNSEDAEFTIETRETSKFNGKIKNVADCESYSRYNIFNQPVSKVGRFVDSDDASTGLGEKQYYLNDKTLIITNKLNNNFYKKYFFDVIIHYLMQMIPSTTILILENFNIDNDQP